MRILFTSLVDPTHSMNNRLHQMVHYLSQRHEVTVLCIHDAWRDSNEKSMTRASRLSNETSIYHVTSLPISPMTQDLLSPVLLKKTGFSDDYDLLLNYNSFVLGWTVGRLVKRKGIPIVYDLADDLLEMMLGAPHIPVYLRRPGWIFGKTVLNRNIDLADMVSVTTPSLASKYRIPDSKAYVVPNGVDTTLFRPMPSGIHCSNELSGPLVIGYVGVYRNWVDFKPLFEALTELTSRYDISLLLVGGEGNVDEVRRMVTDFGLETNTSFVGSVPYRDVPRYIHSMNVCVIPFRETEICTHAFPLKLLEYMACGKPVIAPPLPIIRAIAGDCVLYASTPGQYVKALERTMGRKSTCADTARKARSIALKYDWTRILEEFELRIADLVFA